MNTPGNKRNIETKLRKRAESKVRGIREGYTSRDRTTKGYLTQELEVHQIELEIQNEELIGVKEELESAIKKYEDFYDFAPIGYFTFDRKGRIIEVNLTGSILLNQERSRLTGSKFQKFISAESSADFTSMLNEVFTEKKMASCQVKILIEENSFCYALIKCSRPLNEEKCMAVAADITEIKNVEEKRRQSDEKFKIISTSTPDMILVQDENLRYTWIVNPPPGYTNDEITGKTDKDILGREEAIDQTRIKKRVMVTQLPEKVTIPLRGKDETIYYYEGTYVPLFNSNRIVTGLVGYFRNITERLEAERELSETKRYLEQLINFANAPIIVWNPESEIILFNKAFERLTGFFSNEVLGEKIDILFPKNSLRDSRQKISQALAGDFWETIEIPILCKNGEIKTVLWNSANIHDSETGALISTIAQGNDITSRKKAEEAYAESQRKLNLALENGNIGIWEYDIKTQHLFLDKRMRKMSGIEKSFDGTLSSFEKQINEEDIQQFSQAFSKTIENGSPFESIFRIRRNDSDSTYIEAKGKLYSGSKGHSRILGVAVDITEMKKGSELALFRLNEELSRSNRELQQFAYVASHDLQEPLRMVSSFTQLLEKQYGDKLDDRAREYINFAVEGSKRMYDLINGLLSYSRIQTRGVSFEKVDIESVVRDVLNILQFRIEKKNAKITFCGMPVIRADRNQMMQLFQNLLSNSLKFNNNDPRIDISSRDKGEFHQFLIKDNGLGIDPVYHERIFQIFQRLFTKDEYEGTGIGLSICKRIVERHGGKIWVRSGPGKGTTFYFTIRKEI